MDIKPIYMQMVERITEDLGDAQKPENRNAEEDNKNLAEVYGSALEHIEYEGDHALKIQELSDLHKRTYNVGEFTQYLPYLVQGTMVPCCGEAVAHLVLEHGFKLWNWSSTDLNALDKHTRDSLKTVLDMVKVLKATYENEFQNTVLESLVENWREREKAASAIMREKAEEAQKKKSALDHAVAEVIEKTGVKMTKLPGGLGYVLEVDTD